MTKEVMVTISGLQFDGTVDAEALEVINFGDYYKKDDKHYILYEEFVEGFTRTNQNVIKFREDILDITKKGVTNVHMIFEKNKKNMTYYETPFGNLLVGINAKNVNVRETEESIDVEVDYALEINYEHLADCFIKLNIKSRDSRDFSLQS